MERNVFRAHTNIIRPQLSFDEGEIPGNADFRIRISGGSMEPDISESDIVWVKEQIRIEDGEVGIFTKDSEAYCKWLYIDCLNHSVIYTQRIQICINLVFSITIWNV